MNDIFVKAPKGLGRPAKALFSAAFLGVLAACDLPAVGTQEPGEGTVQVALLVPYGSPTPGDIGLAASLEKAAFLAAADLGDEVEITVYPTSGLASVAAQAASQAVEEGADVILGPLRSDAAAAAAVATRRAGVNVLSFSNNAAIAGGNLFVLGNTFDNTAERVISYAAGQGQSRIAVVHPQTPVGEIARNAIARAAARSGASIVGEQGFEFSQQGIVQAVPAMSALINGSAANAIMITSDSTGALPILAQLLPENGVDPAQFKYLGLARWDIPPQTLAYPGLQGGWFAIPDPALTAQFDARYTAANGEPPVALASLAFDGMAAIGALASQDLAISAGNLTQASGFAGVNGVFRFLPGGTNERALAIAEIQDGQVQIVDPAPNSFGTGGF